MIDEIIKAYIAGIIDGEGSIQMGKVKNKKPFPYVNITTTDHELIYFINEHYPGAIVKQKVYKEHHRQALIWNISYNTALNFLRDIEPYLRIDRKKKRANLLLTRYKKCTPRNGKYTPELLEAKEQLFKDFRTVV